MVQQPSGLQVPKAGSEGCIANGMFVNVRVWMKMCPSRNKLAIFFAILPNRNRRADVHLVG